MTDAPMTNEKGKPIFSLLRQAGLPVQGVVVLGSFVHVECKCDATARKAAKLLNQGGFRLLKISHNSRRKPGYGGACSEYWTAHLQVA